MRTRNLLLVSGALALTLGCGFGSSGGGHSDNNNAGGAPPPAPVATTKAVPEKPATTKAQRTGVPNQSAKIGGCTQVYNGDTCHIKGTGFGYNEKVDVTVVGEGLPTAVRYTDDSGTFTWDYNIRSGPGDVITVRAQGATSGRQAQFSYKLI
jgi:hypothetical protein